MAVAGANVALKKGSTVPVAHAHRAIAHEAPTPESIEFVDSPRYQGWDVPAGEVLYVFSEDECFERIKTQAGSKLDEIMGETTSISSWTTYSV